MRLYIARRVFAFLLSLLFVVMAFAQEEKMTTDFRKAIGMDAVFINNFLPLEQSIGFTNPYEFHFLKYKSDKRFIRHAADLNLFVRKSDSRVNPDIGDQIISMEYKISFGRTREVFNKGYLLWGPEIAPDISYVRRSVEDQDALSGSFENINTETTYELGGGIFVGFEYRFTKSFSVYTEATYHIVPSYSKFNFKSELSPELNFTEEVYQVVSRYRLPSSIILLYSF